MENKSYTISHALIEEIANYLGYRPFKEVANMISKIQKEVQDSVELASTKVKEK